MRARESFTSELMREIERFVILQVVDTRWREHLDAMDYLREGVHLRAMAQKDPLVEYRGEGHLMFEELSRVIREEVVLTLFHVEIAPDEAQDLQPVEAPQALSYEHETAAGAEAIAAAGGAMLSGAAVAAPPAAAAAASGVNEHRAIGRNDPCWCGSGRSSSAPRRLSDDRPAGSRRAKPGSARLGPLHARGSSGLCYRTIPFGRARAATRRTPLGQA
jgi:preprotein translocase subunit SecA